MYLQVLGSSSSGNSTFIREGNEAILVDCGLSPRYISRALSAHGLAISSLSGVLLTHIHGDHFDESMVQCLVRSRVPIFCPDAIAAPLLRSSRTARHAAGAGFLRAVQGRELNIGSFEIAAFEVPHDSPGGCFGYSIARGAQKVTIATDLGFPTEALASRFADSRAIVIESNHDPDMLENSGRPEWLKRRIREIGHLSNEQCAQFVVTVFASSRLPPDAVVLAHISQVCNTNALAVACTESALARSGRANVHIIETFKRHPSRVLSLD